MAFEVFLSEMLCYASPGHKDIATAVILHAGDGNTFDYKAAVFANARVINSILFEWVFRAGYGCPPPKSMVRCDLDTFAALCLAALPVPPSPSLERDFRAFRMDLVRRAATVKRCLYQRLVDRGLSKHPPYDPDATLFSQFHWRQGGGGGPPSNRRHPVTKRVVEASDLREAMFADRGFVRSLSGGCLILLRPELHVEVVTRHYGSLGYVIVAAYPTVDAHHVCAEILDLVLDDVLPLPAGAEVFGRLPAGVGADELTSRRVKPVELPDVAGDCLTSAPMIAAWLDERAMPRPVAAALFAYHKAHYYSLPRWSAVSDDDPPKHCILLVDTRPNIMSVLSVLLTRLNLQRPDDWGVVVVTTEDAREFYAGHFQAVRFIDCPGVSHLNRPFAIDDYNRVMEDPALWSTLEAMTKRGGRCLVVQEDGMLLAPGVERFLEYDYVGAPWPHLGDLRVGNGGLSLRNISRMREITTTFEDEKHGLFMSNTRLVPEDVYFSRLVSNKPSFETAGEFSFEMVLPAPSSRPPCGFHKPWAYADASKIADLVSGYNSVRCT